MHTSVVTSLTRKWPEDVEEEKTSVYERDRVLNNSSKSMKLLYMVRENKYTKGLFHYHACNVETIIYEEKVKDGQNKRKA